MSYFAEVTAEAITAMLNDSKLPHGIYAEALNEFVASKAQHGMISLTEGMFAGKKAQATRTSFLQNVEKLGLENIRVHAQRDCVILSKTA